MSFLTDWRHRVKFTVDTDRIDSDLTHFPIPLILGTNVGQGNDDVSFIFDELAYGSVDDDFTGADGSAPDTVKWTETDANNKLSIYSNSLYFDSQEATDQDTRVTSNYRLRGDFDIQIDVAVLNAGNPTASYHHTMLQVQTTGFYAFITVARGTSGNKYFTVQSTAVSFTAIARSIDTTKLRFTRSGSTLKAYYWSGSQWEWNGNTDGYTFSDIMPSDLLAVLRFKQEGDGSSRWNSSIDNFTVNSGSTWWAGSHPNAKKIAITQAESTAQLYGEIEFWDEENERALIWVSRSSLVLSSSVDTDLYLYFDSTKEDNTTYIGETTSIPGQTVWDSNFIGVFHLSNDPTFGSESYKDSTSNGHHATPNGSMNSLDIVDTPLGKGAVLDGIDDWIEADDTAPHMTGSFTWECMYYSEVLVNSQSSRMINANTAAYGNTFLSYLFKSSVGVLSIRLNDTLSGTYYLTGAYEEAWKTFALTLNGSTNDAEFYDDGVDISALLTPVLSDITSRINSDDRISFGQEWDTGPAATDFFEGTLDEIRLSNTARSAAWLKATHYSLMDDFITWGDEECQNLEDLRLWVGVADGVFLEDLMTDLAVHGQNLEDLSAWLGVADEKLKDLSSWLGVTNGTILKDLSAWLGITDGIVLEDLALWVGIIKAIPAFRSVTAHRVSSVIHEVA